MGRQPLPHRALDLFTSVEALLAGGMAVATAVYVYQIINQIGGAWDSATALLAAGLLLGIVLGAHGAYDLFRLAVFDGAPSDSRLATGVAVWRALELAFVVAFVTFWLLTALMYPEPSSPARESEGGFILLAGLLFWLVLAAAAETAVVGMVVLRSLGTLVYRLKSSDADR